MTVTLPLPFRASRSLESGNALLGEAGVTLDVVGLDFEDDIRAAWQRRVEGAARQLGWPAPRILTFATGPYHTLCFTAPANQLRTACRTNEWALCAAVLERDPYHWGALRESSCLAEDAAMPAARQRHRPVTDRFAERAALERLRRLAQAEALAPQVAV